MRTHVGFDGRTGMLTDTYPIFDVTGLSILLVAIAFFKSPAGQTLGMRQMDPRVERYYALINASSKLAASVATVYFLSSHLGFNKLVNFVFDFNDGRHTWTVWLTLGLWSITTLEEQGALGLVPTSRPNLIRLLLPKNPNGLESVPCIFRRRAKARFHLRLPDTIFHQIQIDN